MSVYYDLYASGNPQKKDEQQPLHARVIPSGTLDAKKFIELVSKSNGFSQATIEGCLQAITDELQHWLETRLDCGSRRIRLFLLIAEMRPPGNGEERNPLSFHPPE